MEVTMPWGVQIARNIPNDGGVVLVLIIRQLVKQYTYFACCQIVCFFVGGEGLFPYITR